MDITARIFICLFFIFNISLSASLNQSLKGNWTARNANGTINIEGKVPGGIYTDLMNAEVIDDIFFRYNDVMTRWVAYDNWTYTKHFQVDSKILTKQNIYLVFHGLDTVANITLNGNLIGQAENMFVRYKFDVKPFLKNENTLTVDFTSAVLESRARYLAEKQRSHEVPPTCVPKEYQGECHANHLRKMQASFSWDWGPAFPSVGIWRNVEIEGYNSAVIRDVIISTKRERNSWIIDVGSYLESSPRALITGKIYGVLNTDSGVNGFSQDVQLKTDAHGELLLQSNFSVSAEDVKMWWPNGYGDQNLYKLNVTFASDSETSTKIISIGFRTVELVQKPAADNSSFGLTFYFRVNDVPMFAKGSNWIPAHILPELGTDEATAQRLLTASADVHMNMLRVWGGGIYESDEFYEIADRLGILIWQDFMFACSMYPTNDEFLSSVETEVYQQMRRLQHHASVVLWAGNNENEAALRGNWYGTAGNFNVYKKDYVKLYVDVIRNTALVEDSTREFLVSSPSNGIESETEGYVAKNPYDNRYGDVHYYNYILDGWDQNIYPKTRFASEYGFQSFPSFLTLKSITQNSQELPDLMSFRQHHPGGNLEMRLLIERHLKFPKNESSENHFKTFVFYSQISQAMAVKAQTEFYRQLQSTLTSTGEGLTMGALYWQLNDVWQAPSWSSLDFAGRWKMLHYYAKKFFSPVLVSANISPSSELSIYVISDLTTAITRATLQISVYKWDSFTPVSTKEQEIMILPGIADTFFQVWLTEYLEKINCTKNDSFLYLNLIISDFQKDSLNEVNGVSVGNKLSDNFVFFGSLKHAIGLTKPEIKAKVLNENTDGSFNIEITTNTITPFVWLQTDNVFGHFSDNGFLQIEPKKIIQFYPDKPVTSKVLISALTITSLLGDH